VTKKVAKVIGKAHREWGRGKRRGNSSQRTDLEGFQADSRSRGSTLGVLQEKGRSPEKMILKGETTDPHCRLQRGRSEGGKKIGSLLKGFLPENYIYYLYVGQRRSTTRKGEKGVSFQENVIQAF